MKRIGIIQEELKSKRNLLRQVLKTIAKEQYLKSFWNHIKKEMVGIPTSFGNHYESFTYGNRFTKKNIQIVKERYSISRMQYIRH